MPELKPLVAALAMLAAPLAAAPAIAQTDMENPAGSWTHAPSGVTFPAAAPGFKRTKIQRFDDEANDVGVTYLLEKDGKPFGVTSLYVYPAGPGTCEDTWAEEKESSDKGGSQILSEERAASPGGKTANAAYHAGVDMHLGRPDMPATTKLYFYCVPGGHWLVKYYASWIGTDDHEPETVALMRAISWPAAFR